MFRRVFQSALAAGLIAGVLITVLHQFTTTPLILAAEVFEAANTASSASANVAAAPTAHSHAAQFDPERLLFSTLTNIIIGAGYALLLVAGFSFSGSQVDGRRGGIWGICGFTAFALAPALGLPPELPGMVAADITARQTWWLATVSASIGGLWLLISAQRWELAAAGIVLLAAPHIIGAPHPNREVGIVPPELSAQFAVTSLVVGAIFWTLIGWLAGTFWARGETEY